MIKLYNKLINQITNLMKDLAAIVLVFITFLVVANIILRATISAPIQGVYDLVVVLTTVVISLSVAYCAVKDGHVAVSLLIQRLPQKAQNVIDFITGSIVFVILILVTWNVLKHAQTMHLNGEVTNTVGIPFAPFIVLIAVGIALLALVVLGKILNLFVKEGEQ